MILDQYYLSCLSQASYLVADPVTRRAVVVDPRRDVQEYVDDAAAQGLRIELVVLTHVHADFVPGHTELAERTGAEIAMSELAPVKFPIRKLSDGERITLGDPQTGVVIEILATPGHTPESITLAVFERGSDPAPHAILTGDTLFLGDVGRPDLLGAAGRTPADMAKDLYASLQRKILSLPDQVLVYPGHGAGSACGKSLSTDTVSTLGEQRRTNYALAPMSEEDFVEVVTRGLGAPPAYFIDEVRLNTSGHLPFDPAVPVPVIDAVTAVRRQQNGYLLLDVRDDQAFAAGHLLGAINVGLSGRFAEYAAAMHTTEQPVILVGDAEQCHEARLRLARVGIDQVTAQVSDLGEIERNSELVSVSSRLTAGQAAQRLSDGGVQVVDVRAPAEHVDGAMPGALNIDVTRLRTRLFELDPRKPTIVHCAGGYRSIAAASLLEANGFSDVSDVLGGSGAWTAWRAAAWAVRPGALPDGKDPRYFISYGSEPFEVESHREPLAASVITSNELMFIRQNLPLPDPSILDDRDSWAVRVEGVQNPREITVAELRTLGSVEIVALMQCSGNGRGFAAHGPPGSPWRVGALGNVRWTGIPVAAVVAALGGVTPGARFLTAAGNEPLPAGKDPLRNIVERSIPVEKGLADCLLAWEMNGEPIPLAHGGPLRLIVPGYWGINSIKFLGRLAFTPEETQARIQRLRYRMRPVGVPESPDQPTMWGMNVKSLIVYPTDRDRVSAGPVQIRGYAWAGEVEVARVEVSCDGGTTWRDAELAGPGDGPAAWREFRYTFAAEQEEYRLVSRATDVDGNCQPEFPEANERGYGHNGWRHPTVTLEVG